MTPRQTALLIPFAAVFLAAAACSSTPKDMTVNGTLTAPNLLSGSPVQNGSQVTVTDPSGKVIGYGVLSEDTANANTVLYRFAVKVPEGETSYGVTVSGLNGVTRYNQAQMQQGPALCSGTAC